MQKPGGPKQSSEMEELLSMGFSNELAAEALAATGGKSTLKATEWILSHHSTPATPTPNANPNPNSNPSPRQPKLNRFFHPKPQPQTQTQTETQTESQSQTQTLTTSTNANDPDNKPKRPKLLQPNNSYLPLSERMRPRTLNDVVGQDHLLSPQSLLQSSLSSNRLPSIILWGPPGTGKTSIAKTLTYSSNDPSVFRFVSLSAVTSGVKDVRDAVEEARNMRLKYRKRTVLFVDEVHRFNKSQQDSFLPVIEDGSIVFVGATTENPSFHLITPLLSRCRVLTLNPLKPGEIASVIARAVDDKEKGLLMSLDVDKVRDLRVSEDAVEFLTLNCDGDARVALNALEVAGVSAASRVKEEVNDGVVVMTIDEVKEALQCKTVAYDKAGDEHYNLISALHKSMRGNDADAAIYWLARMLEGGEVPLYIARRLIRFASEDVGLADPSALTQAVSCYQACHFIGLPECNVVLAQCVAYLALAPKSIAVYRAIGEAQKVVRESVGGNEGVPLHLRNAPTKLMKELGYGKDYIYTPDNPLTAQSFLPPSLQGHKFLHWDGSRSAEK